MLTNALNFVYNVLNYTIKVFLYIRYLINHMVYRLIISYLLYGIKLEMIFLKVSINRVLPDNQNKLVRDSKSQNTILLISDYHLNQLINY